MIRFGEQKDIPKLKKLWKACFADEDAYIDTFFEELYQNRNVLLEEENGVLMGASFFLPGEIYLEQTEEDGARNGAGNTSADRAGNIFGNGAGSTSADGAGNIFGDGAGSTSADRAGNIFGNGAGSTSGEWRWIRYVYALAVYPQFRGRGIAGKLLHRACEVYEEPLVAEPAEEGLVGGFYKPLGFTETFYLEKTWIEMPQYDVRAAEILSMESDYDIYPVRAEEYCRLRDFCFRKHGYVSWPEQHVSFAIREHRCSGGGALGVRRKEKRDLILYYKEEQDIVVTETSLTLQETAELFLPWIAGQCSRLVLTRAANQRGVMQEVSAGQEEKNGSVLQQAGASVTGCRRYLTGMSYGLPLLDGYLNLSLD